MPIQAPIGPSDLGARVAAVLHSAGFSGSALVLAVAIAKAESGWSATAKGGPNKDGSYDWGLMQINDVHKPTEEQKFNPVHNALLAFRIYRDAGGFKPWSTYNSGAYAKHVDMAKDAVTQLQNKGSEWERKVVAEMKDGTKVGTGLGLPDVNIPNPLSGLSAVSETLTRVMTSGLTVAVAALFIVLGIVILLRKPVSRAVKPATKTVGTVAGMLPQGKAAKAVGGAL